MSHSLSGVSHYISSLSLRRKTNPSRLSQPNNQKIYDHEKKICEDIILDWSTFYKTFPPPRMCPKICTCVQDHLDAPGQRPEPADQQEGHGAKLRCPNEHVDAKCDDYRVAFTGQSGFTATQCEESTDNRA